MTNPILRIVPHSETYETVDKLNTYARRLLYFSTVLSLAMSIAERNDFLTEYKYFPIGLNILVICLFVFLENRANYLYTKAEMKRRLDLLDNSFDTNFSGKKSQNYFTNEHLSPGIYKLAVNCFENSFHTHSILSKMCPKVIIRNVIIVLIFVASTIIGDREIVRLFFELALPLALIQELIKITIFSARIERVFDNAKTLFNDLRKTNFDDKTAQALKEILEYESAVSWASTPLDSNIFFKNKDRLATEWAELKKEYNIK